MTQDFVALTPKMPDARTLLAGLYAGGPDLRVDSVVEGAAIRLRSPDGRPLVTVEVPLFLQVPGEVSRLLGETVLAEAPVWWTEVRAITAVEEAGRLAGSVAGRMTAVLGGTSWPPGAAHTRVVSVPSENGNTATAADDDHPLPVDVLTDRGAVVFQDRPVVAATTWLSDLLQDAVSSGREVQIVTPPNTRLTLPARALLTSLPARWIIRDPEGSYYDGLTGAVLHWHAGHFTPALTADGSLELAEAFTPPAASQRVGEQQLILTIRTIHPATEHLLLGGTLETCWQALTGSPPAGWSTAEPVNLPWSPRQLTELARIRAQKSAPTWLVTVGAPARPAIATLRIAHTPAGVEEHITLAVGYAADEPAPLDALPDLADALATRHHLASMLIHLRRARSDLNIPPHREPPPIPISYTLGPNAVHMVGRKIAEAAPTTRPTRLGPATRPGFHYPLGDGTDPTAWQHLKQLNNHLTTRP